MSKGVWIYFKELKMYLWYVDGYGYRSPEDVGKTPVWRVKINDRDMK